MKPGTKVKFGDRVGVVVDWKKYPNFLKKTASGTFDFRTEAIVKSADGLHVVKHAQLKETLEGKEIRKITEGCVIQRWDKETGKFLGQEFVAGDLCGYEDENGNEIDNEDGEMVEPEYRTYDMVQDPPIVKSADGLHVVKHAQLKETLEGKEIRKITEGCVIQRWDKETGKFLGQEFVADNEDGEMVEPEYRTYDMVQDPPTGFTFRPDHRPDGPVCSVCGKECAPSGVDGGSWVHVDSDGVD